MGQKLCKAEIKQLPAGVRDRVLEIQQRYHTRFCELDIESPGWCVYLDEGVKYTAFDAKGQELATIRMQSQSSLHAGGGWQSHQIGKQIPIPQGAWVVEFELFLGKPFIHVHHVGLIQVGGEGTLRKCFYSSQVRLRVL